MERIECGYMNLDQMTVVPFTWKTHIVEFRFSIPQMASRLIDRAADHAFRSIEDFAFKSGYPRACIHASLILTKHRYWIFYHVRTCYGSG